MRNDNIYELASDAFGNPEFNRPLDEFEEAQEMCNVEVSDFDPEDEMII